MTQTETCTAENRIKAILADQKRQIDGWQNILM